MSMTGNPWFGGYDRPTRPGVHPERVLAAVRETFRDLPMKTFPAALRPFEVPARSYAELSAAGSMVLDLLRRTLLSISPTFAGRLAKLGVEAELHPLVLADEVLEERYSTLVCRPDLVIGPDGPRFLEFNVSSAVGGIVDTHLYGELWRGLGLSFTHTDPLRARNAMLREVCAELGVPARAVLLSSIRKYPPGTSSRIFDIQLDAMRSDGLAATFTEPEDLLDVLGEAGCAVGLRQFTVPEWLAAGIDLEPVRRALNLGCLLLPTQTSFLIANKIVMAWASEGQPWMSSADRRIIDRYLPWTRVVADTRTHWHGRDHELVPLLHERREAFVVKGASGREGTEVVVGAVTTPDLWERTIDKALGGWPAVVQEYVKPAECLVEVVDESGQTGAVPVFPVFSPFLFGGRGGGCKAKYQPADGVPGVINVSLGARSNLVVGVD
jgi:hypothetical protein